MSQPGPDCLIQWAKSRQRHSRRALSRMLALLYRLREDSIEKDASNPLEIAHDVWIGTGAIILPKSRRIGNGAGVGAGSAVTRDVEPFTIVAGNPAHFIKHRFPPEVIEKINASEWWNIELPELVQHFPVFVNPAPLESIERLTELGPSRHSTTAGS